MITGLQILWKLNFDVNTFSYLMQKKVVMRGLSGWLIYYLNDKNIIKWNINFLPDIQTLRLFLNHIRVLKSRRSGFRHLKSVISPQVLFLRSRLTLSDNFVLRFPWHSVKGRNLKGHVSFLTFFINTDGNRLFDRRNTYLFQNYKMLLFKQNCCFELQMSYKIPFAFQ